MNRLALTATLALLAVGCQPQVTDTKTVEIPEGGPFFELPSGGYVFDYTAVDQDGSVMFDGQDFWCFIEQSADGRAADYCGFVITTTNTGYSFDTKIYAWNGVTVTGSGNADGATLTQLYEDGTSVTYTMTNTDTF